jgi:predicted nucleic acid-binding protein
VSRIFVDAAYYIGILLEEDELHDRALAIGRELDEFARVTTDSVLAEVLAYFSRRGPRSREAAAALIDELHDSTGTTIVHQDAALFFEGVALYRARPDKGYSLTDCMSMIICRREDITEVLTHDRHFTQEGFDVLL